MPEIDPIEPLLPGQPGYREQRNKWGGILLVAINVVVDAVNDLIGRTGNLETTTATHTEEIEQLQEGVSPVTDAGIAGFLDEDDSESSVATLARVKTDLEKTSGSVLAPVVTAQELAGLTEPGARRDAVDARAAAIVPQAAVEAAQDELNPFGAFLSNRLRGAAPRSLSMSGPKRFGRAPGVEISPVPLFTTAQTVLANLYWPQIIDLRGMYRANGTTPIPYDWAMVYSTDHQGTARCAIAFKGNGDGTSDPRDPAGWAEARVVIDSSNGGSNTETPRLMFSEQLNKWLFYFSTSAAYGGSVQHTRIFQANEIDAVKADWSDTGVHVALTVAEAARLPGDGHTGYKNPFRIGSAWYAYSLLGGQDAGMNALWRSRDGLNWVRDPVPLLWDQHLADPSWSSTSRLSIGVGPLFQYEGTTYALAGSGTPASGAVQTTSKRFLGRVTDNLRALVDQPSELKYTTQTWMGTGSFTPLSTFEYAGDIYCPFTSGDSTKIGLGRLVF